MKKVLLGIMLITLMAPLAGCVFYERYDDGYFFRRPYRPYPRYSYLYRPYYDYGYRSRFHD